MTKDVNNSWPAGFPEQMESILTGDTAAFFQAHQQTSPVAIRMNPLKPTLVPVRSQAVPWCEGGWYLSKRPKFILDPYWHAGCYYVQEPSSMIIDLVVRELDLTDRPLAALDLCASPGGKATIISSALHPESFILANEVNRKRFFILRNNMIRWGHSNVFMTNEDPRAFSSHPGLFDLILVDAPCSGEGLFRKDPRSREQWSKTKIKLCSRRQLRILEDVLPALKPGGILLYSTCTYNHEENISVVQQMVRSGLEAIEIPAVKVSGFVKLEEGRAVGYQAFPHLVKGEGFFLAVMRKPPTTVSRNTRIKRRKRQFKIPDGAGTFLSSEIIPHLQMTRNKDLFYLAPAHEMIFQLLNDGMKIWPNPLGQLKKNFVPHHGLAMRRHFFTGLSIELDFDQALQYLYKNPVEGFNGIRGWHLVTFGGNGLGWVKGIGHRYNNYLPNELRILRDIQFLRNEPD